MFHLNRRQLEREGRKELVSSGNNLLAICCDLYKDCPVCVKGAFRMNVPCRHSLRDHSGWFSDMLSL